MRSSRETIDEFLDDFKRMLPEYEMLFHMTYMAGGDSKNYFVVRMPDQKYTWFQFSYSASKSYSRESLIELYDHWIRGLQYPGMNVFSCMGGLLHDMGKRGYTEQVDDIRRELM